MRSHEKNIDRFPDTDEVLAMIDEHEDLKEAMKIRNEIQQILDI